MERLNGNSSKNEENTEGVLLIFSINFFATNFLYRLLFEKNQYISSKIYLFHAQNRLIYAFQKNIILNKLITKYFKWFDVAYKSRNINNSEEDFSQYNDDNIMAEVIKRLKRDQLTTEEYKFVSDLPLYEAYYGNLKQEIEIITQQAEAVKKEADKKVLQAEQKVQAEQQKVQAEQQKRQGEHQKLLKGIENLLRRGDTVESIADLLVRSVDEIAGFVTEIEAKKGAHLD
jgi:hypothetical protein